MSSKALTDQSITPPGDLAGSIPGGIVLAAARDTLAEYKRHESEIVRGISAPADTDYDRRASYWLGRLEGTILTLLSVMPDGEGYGDGRKPDMALAKV